MGIIEILCQLCRLTTPSLTDIMRMGDINMTEKERLYEYGLPEYLQHDLDEYKKGLKEHSSLLDCLWGELYGSINIAEINDGFITPEHADYLRQKFLYGVRV